MCVFSFTHHFNSVTVSVEFSWKKNPVNFAYKTKTTMALFCITGPGLLKSSLFKGETLLWVMTCRSVVLNPSQWHHSHPRALQTWEQCRERTHMLVSRTTPSAQGPFLSPWRTVSIWLIMILKIWFWRNSSPQKWSLLTFHSRNKNTINGELFL